MHVQLLYFRAQEVFIFNYNFSVQNNLSRASEMFVNLNIKSFGELMRTTLIKNISYKVCQKNTF